jgi:uncharacterized membrane protein YphA (DoxX/SURF4 family)
MSNSQVMRRGLDWWNIGLWIVQVLLAVMFAFAGYLKATKAPETLVAEMGWGWAATLPAWFIIFLGVMELLGAIGAILPAATRILPWLTPLAAAGMIVVQLAAIVLHATRGETGATIGINLVLLAGAAFVLWGRTRKRVMAGR